MNGIGNAILVVDLRGGGRLDGETAQALGALDGCAFDQLMAIEPPRSAGTAAFVTIYNADGSTAGACGNGTRCVAWVLLEGTGGDAITVQTEAGLLACTRLAPESFAVDMGRPALGWHAIPLRDAVADTASFHLTPHAAWMDALGPVSAVGMGNPHAVFWLDPARPVPDLAHLGPSLEHHPAFPARANISFARRLASDHVALDVWERGAGLTKACGSAACATLVSGVRTQRTDRRATIDLPGGTLEIAWRSDDHVVMTGPVELEGRGTFDLARRARVG